MANLDQVLADPNEGTRGKAGRMWLGPLGRDDFLQRLTRGALTDNGMLLEFKMDDGTVAVWEFRHGF